MGQLPELRIGDDWSAIQILARSQSNPRKAIAELIENSIDAGARKIVVTKAKAGEWRIWDDGKGLPPGTSGAPDFEYMITHICDSIKKKLGERERRGMQGEFGIGFLGFWTLSREALFIARGPAGPTRAVLFKAGERSPTEVRPRARKNAGSEVILRSLTKAGSRMRCEALARYLAEELRARIKDASLIVKDKRSRKTFPVQAEPFKGRRIESIARVSTPLGPVRFDLYIAPAESETPPVVGIYRKGTRILADICELDPFQCHPWNSGKVEGLIEFNALNVPPGTRLGLVPDERRELFVKSVGSVQDTVSRALSEYEKELESRADRQIYAALSEAFAKSMDELSSLGFSFERGRGKREPTGKPRGLGKARPGEMEHVVISPRIAEVAPGEEKIFTAKAVDVNGKPVLGVKFLWRLEPEKGVAGLTSFINRAAVTAGSLTGEGKVFVVARQGKMEEEEFALIIISDQVSRKAQKGRGLPTPRRWPGPQAGPRSRLDEKLGLLEYNINHRDYKVLRRAKDKFMYLASLYAKELAVFSFPGCAPSEAIERSMDFMSALRPNLPSRLQG